MGSITPPMDEIHDQDTEQYVGLKKLQLSRNLSTFPPFIHNLASTLTHLDLSNNPLLSALPPSISQLTNLKILFLSNCSFSIFPNLSQCPSLEMVAFKSNAMTTIPDSHLPPKLRWLILTNNNISALPSDIGICKNLTKCLLAGNALTHLPESMKGCRNLTLLRLSQNKLSALPSWLLTMPSLAFLSYAGNPCNPDAGKSHTTLPLVPWSDLKIGALLGEGASGVISKAEWTTRHDERSHVAVKVFKGSVTSDGSPLDELAATIAAGRHANLVSPLGLTSSDVDGAAGHPGLVMELIPPHYVNLGLPPSLQTCARDTFASGTSLSIKVVVHILRGVASAAAHLHGRGVMHGDLYAHNILNDASGHALLGDFGAASVYFGEAFEGRMEQLEVLAFGFLVEDLLSLVAFDVAMVGEKEWSAVQRLRELKDICASGIVNQRPVFAEIVETLREF